MTHFISADRLRLYELWEAQAWTEAANEDDAEKRRKLVRKAKAYRVRINAIKADDQVYGECK